MGRSTTTSNFMSQLRMIILDNYKDNKVLDLPAGRYIRKEMDADRLSLIKDLTELLMNTDYISKESKIYLKTPYINYQGVVDEMYMEYGKITSVSNVQSKIWYDKGKLVKEFGANLPMDIMEYTNHSVKGYMDALASLRLKITKEDLLEEVALKFKKEVVYCDSISDEEFEDFIDIIAPYTPRVMNRVASAIDEKILGYIRYITTRHNLNETDMKRYNELKELIR